MEIYSFFVWKKQIQKTQIVHFRIMNLQNSIQPQIYILAKFILFYILSTLPFFENIIR